uniref:G-protein coupled receptors family 1 profile domain-containing protein n=1 Tax=Capitella teleta TaxID=283909 RepID=X1Z4V3_CAPTE
MTDNSQSIENSTSSAVEFSNASFPVNLELMIGPKQPEFPKLISITIIYCVIFFTGVIGNVCTCIVIAKKHYMHTATNYYLFNLACADILVLVLGLPQETYTLWSAYPWIFGEPYCIVRNMAAETSTYASILTITAFTMERYVAICHPMRAKTLSSLKRAVRAIILLWIVSGLCAIPIVMQYGVVYVSDPNNGSPIKESALCNIRKDRYIKHIFEAATFLFFLTPMTVISVFYVLIGLAIRRSVQSCLAANRSNTARSGVMELRVLQQAQARRAVLKMLGRVYFNTQ